MLPLGIIVQRSPDKDSCPEVFPAFHQARCSIVIRPSVEFANELPFERQQVSQFCNDVRSKQAGTAYQLRSAGCRRWYHRFFCLLWAPS
jgi:hypothetical protein